MENNYTITIKKKNDIPYSVRRDRSRYFFPDEWIKFISTFKNEKHKILFETLLFTGARIMEALHLKSENFDWKRETVKFSVVKQRKAKKRFYALGTTRTFFISPKYLRKMKKYIKDNKIKEEEYIFLDNNSLPDNYDSLDNKEKQKYFKKYTVSYHNLLKRRLKMINIKDWQNFSLHNIRKTYGNWMRISDIKIEELCYRMGNDIQTFLSHYGSSLIFNSSEKRQILHIFGEIK